MITVQGPKLASPQPCRPLHYTVAELNDVRDTEASLQALSPYITDLTITSTPSLDLGADLDRLTGLTTLHIQCPQLQINYLPATLETLILNVYSMEVLSDTNLAGDLDLSDSGLKELYIYRDSDFGTDGDLILPDSLQRLVLNRTCTSYIRNVPLALQDVAVCCNYPFPEVFHCSSKLRLYN